MSESLISTKNIVIQNDGGPYEPLDTNGPDADLHQAALANLDAYRQEMRDSLLETIPEDREGLDLDSVDSFFGKEGMEPARYLVIPESDVREAKSKLVETGLIDEAQVEDFGAFYSAPVELSFAYRDKAAEEANGPGFLESVLVHEGAHSTSKVDIWGFHTSPEGASLSVFRMGQVALGAGTRGIFIEEGFADTARAKYVTEVLDKPGGFANVETERDTCKAKDGTELPVLPAYSYRQPTGEAQYTYNTRAGSAIGFLVENDPPLWDAMVRARTSVEGLREVARRIDAVRPGLYMDLHRLSLSAEDFDEGLRMVAEALDIQAPSAESKAAA